MLTTNFHVIKDTTASVSFRVW